MSISALGYTPGVAEIKDIASKIAYGKQVVGDSGADLGTPDTFGQFPYLKDFDLGRSYSVRTDKFWNGGEYTLGTDKSSEAKLTVLSRLKAVVQDMASAMEGNYYHFLVEQNDEAIAGMYQLAAFVGEVTGLPGLNKSPDKEFTIKPVQASADIVLDIKAIEADLANLSIALPIGASITIPKGEFFGLYEVAWP